MLLLTKSIRKTNSDLKVHLGEASTLVETTRVFRLTLYWSSELLFESQRKIAKGFKPLECNSETLFLLGVINKIPKQSFALADKLKKHSFLEAMQGLEWREEDEDTEDEDVEEDTKEEELDTFAEEEQENWFSEIFNDLEDFANLLEKTSRLFQQEAITNDIRVNNLSRTIRLEIDRFIDYCRSEAADIREFIAFFCYHQSDKYVCEGICRERIIKNYKRIKSLRFKH